MRFKKCFTPAAIVLVATLVACSSDPEQLDIPVSEMTDEQLQQKYISDIHEMEQNNPPAEGDMAAALRFAIEAKQLESVQEMERRNDEATQGRLQEEQMDRAKRAEIVREENARMEKEAEDEERLHANNIARSLEAARQESLDSQAEDIRLLEENRLQSGR